MAEVVRDINNYGYRNFLLSRPLRILRLFARKVEGKIIMGLIDLKLDKVLEITFTLIMLYLILVNYKGFSNVVSSLGGAYTGAVKALQGRG
jgi:hypothetical protein